MVYGNCLTITKGVYVMPEEKKRIKDAADKLAKVIKAAEKAKK